MNERIQKLLTMSTDYKLCELTGVSYSVVDYAAFAELIVDECAAAVRNTNLEDVEGGDSSVLYAAATQLKERFK